MTTNSNPIPRSIVCMLCMVFSVLFAVYLTLVVNLGKFAFGNPNESSWYGVIDGKECLFATAEEAHALSATDVTDAHSPFLRWFLWGFFQTLILPCATLIIFGICFTTAPTYVTCIDFTGNVFGTTAWLIYGLAWRFSAVGKYASGDIVPEGIEKDNWEENIS